MNVECQAKAQRILGNHDMHEKHHELQTRLFCSARSNFDLYGDGTFNLGRLSSNLLCSVQVTLGFIPEGCVCVVKCIGWPCYCQLHGAFGDPILALVVVFSNAKLSSRTGGEQLPHVPTWRLLSSSAHAVLSKSPQTAAVPPAACLAMSRLCHPSPPLSPLIQVGYRADAFKLTALS
jgi:hypothetical protein